MFVAQSHLITRYKKMPMYLNNELVKSFNFSGGECHVKVTADNYKVANITALINSAGIFSKTRKLIAALKNLLKVYCA